MRQRPSLGHRLAPVLVLPVAFALLGVVRGATHGLAHASNVEVERDVHAHAAPRPAKATPSATAEPELEVLSLCAPGMAIVERDSVRVCVDRWEASIVEVLPNGEEKPWSPYMTPRTKQGARVKAVTAPNATPQAYVTRQQAALACKNAGKRLCTGKEWRTACEGPEKTTWPYGNAEDPAACNTHGINPMKVLLGGPRAGMWGSAMQHPLLNTFPQTLAKTGAYARCTNDYGLYDMVGNLHEWTADGDFRGGYYRDDHVNAPGCRYKTTAHKGAYADYSTGFRCCADPG